MVMHNLLIDILGWIGAITLLVAYGLVSTKKTEGNSVFYQLLNLAGSGLLMINSFFYGAYPSSGLNIVWVGIAIFTIMRTRFSWHSPSNS